MPNFNIPVAKAARKHPSSKIGAMKSKFKARRHFTSKDGRMFTAFLVETGKKVEEIVEAGHITVPFDKLMITMSGGHKHVWQVE